MSITKTNGFWKLQEPPRSKQLLWDLHAFGSNQIEIATKREKFKERLETASNQSDYVISKATNDLIWLQAASLKLNNWVEPARFTGWNPNLGQSALRQTVRLNCREQPRWRLKIEPWITKALPEEQAQLNATITAYVRLRVKAVNSAAEKVHQAQRRHDQRD